MEDIMHIQSKFLRLAASSAINKAIGKYGPNSATVVLNDIFVSHCEKNGKVHAHLDVDINISRDDLVEILEKAGVL